MRKADEAGGHLERAIPAASAAASAAATARAGSRIRDPRRGRAMANRRTAPIRIGVSQAEQPCRETGPVQAAQTALTDCLDNAMPWILPMRRPQADQGAPDWTEESYPSRDDALTACEAILRGGGVIASLVERLPDGSVVPRLDHRDVLRALNIRDD